MSTSEIEPDVSITPNSERNNTQCKQNVSKKVARTLAFIVGQLYVITVTNCQAYRKHVK